MKILITGNMGYVGPSVVDQLRASYPTAILEGFDIGYFGNCIRFIGQFQFTRQQSLFTHGLFCKPRIDTRTTEEQEFLHASLPGWAPTLL